MLKYKEFKSPTQEPVRILSSDGMIISWIYPEWTMVREELWMDSYSKGCISKDMNRIGVDATEAIANLQAQERAFEETVKKTMAELIAEGDPENLDAAGRPKVDVIGDIIGKIPTATLRNRLFKEITK